MKKGRLYNRQEIEVISKSAIGRTMNDILKDELVSIGEIDNKGGLGNLVEQYLFGIQTNNESEPDFMPAGIELKVTPYKKIKGGKLSAKERLVLNIINYMEEWKNDFRHSHFWMKNNTIQLLWYLWEPNKDFKDFKITHERLMELVKSEDIKQIETDWNYIVNKIKDGKAHELSEADTMYLGACTKGANSSSKRDQPFSDIKAMQRAFCFKNSYMTQLVRKIIGDYSDVEKILKDSSQSFDNYVKETTNKYIGKSESELLNIFNISSKSKDKFSLIVNRMFNIKKGLRNSEEFLKANIIPKTIRIEKTGRIKESISFPIFRFKEIINENWEDSSFKEELETTKYMFFIFERQNGEYIFKGYKLWNMPQIIIDTVVKKFWKKTINTIKEGVKFTISGNNVYNNLPGIADNGYVHVRPHTSKAAYKLSDGYEKGNISKYADQLPNGEWMTKQCFWFNNTYIKDIIEQ